LFLFPFCDYEGALSKEPIPRGLLKKSFLTLPAGRQAQSTLRRRKARKVETLIISSLRTLRKFFASSAVNGF
jgi:hypothetical protein